MSDRAAYLSAWLLCLLPLYDRNDHLLLMSDGESLSTSRRHAWVRLEKTGYRPWIGAELFFHPTLKVLCLLHRPIVLIRTFAFSSLPRNVFYISSSLAFLPLVWLSRQGVGKALSPFSDWGALVIRADLAFTHSLSYTCSICLSYYLCNSRGVYSRCAFVGSMLAVLFDFLLLLTLLRVMLHLGFVGW